MERQIHTQDRTAIDAAYAHMAEVDAARLKGEETSAERALLDARTGIKDEISSSSQASSAESNLNGGSTETNKDGTKTKPALQHRQRPKGGRPRKPTHEQLVDNARAALQSRKVTRIVSAEQAVGIWKAVRLYDGILSGGYLPSGVGKSSERVGLPVEEQVAMMVERTPGFAEWRASVYGAERWFMGELDAQLPQEFAHPWEGLCGAERDALGSEARMALAGGNEQLDEAGSKPSAKGEDRLLPGMRRLEESG